MASVQGKNIIIFQLLTVIIVSVGMAYSDAPKNISYTCDENGVSSLRDIVNFKNYVIMSGVSNQGEWCKLKDANLTGCPMIKKMQLYVVYGDESKNNILGQSSTFFKLTCTDNPTVVTKTATGFKLTSEPKAPVTESVDITHSFNLLLKKGTDDVDQDTPLDIGDELKLQMTGTGVVISPLRCIAYPQDKTNFIEIWNYTKYKNDTEECKNEHPSIISTKQWEKIKPNENNIEVTVYAFRFASSELVNIECMATVCSITQTGKCTKACIKQVRRRRRHAASKKKYSEEYQRSSSVSFAISTKEFSTNNSPGLIVGFTKYFMFTLSLVCAYST